MDQVESAGLTDVGRKRKVNQDAFFLDNGMGLYVVADGMGGHKAGEVAARTVVESLREAMAGSGTAGSDPSLSPDANRLLGAIQLANRKVYQASHNNETFRGMGATVSAVYLSGDTIIAANVGDSPIYLIHQNDISEISVPHTLEAEQAAADPGGDHRSDSSLHHILTRAVGVRETVTPHICELQGFLGDILVLASDGLSNKVAVEEVRGTAQAMLPGQGCRHLVDLANSRGGEDNITVVITRLKPAGHLDHPLITSLFRLFRKTFSGIRMKR